MYAYFLKKILIGFTVASWCNYFQTKLSFAYQYAYGVFFFFHYFKVTKLNDPATAKFKI